MIYDPRTYSVLIVSASQKMTSQITTVLSSESCYPIVSVADISAAKREALERVYDFVIINSPLPDDTGARFALDCSENHNTVCLLMLRAEDFEDIDSRVSDSGVYTVSKPISAQTFSLSLHWMKTTRERLRQLDKKAVTLEDRMEEIRIINRAKWVLINNMEMTEEEAHRYLEKQAMNTGSTKVEIAKQIIEKSTS